MFRKLSSLDYALKITGFISVVLTVKALLEITNTKFPQWFIVAVIGSIVFLISLVLGECIYLLSKKRINPLSGTSIILLIVCLLIYINS